MSYPATYISNVVTHYNCVNLLHLKQLHILCDIGLRIGADPGFGNGGGGKISSEASYIYELRVK